MITCVLYILLIPAVLVADSTSRHPEREFEALRKIDKIKVDGYLDEVIWLGEAISGFTQRDPIEGAEPSQRTEVWVAYDDEALYIAARLHDTFPDSIVARLARRDDYASSDKFTFKVDPWLDHRTGFFFGVNAAGAISDGILFNDDWSDDSWDGVWESAVSIDEKGWTLEMRIPYSQLRFPEKEVHIWGVNFSRYIQRRAEFDMLVMKPKDESGSVSRFAHLNGITGISPPRNLEFLPYTAGSSESIKAESGNPFNDGSKFIGAGGLDVKMGLSSNLTLDATFNPDFGQVEVDPAVVNLSDFETFFPEKRPFFIEGSNIFSFGYGGVNNNWSFNYGNPDQFYSRRIGRAPQAYPVRSFDYKDTPSGTTILGAAKVSGKLTPEWSIGVMNALTASEYAELDSSGVHLREEVEPMTDYTVVRTQREFKEGKYGLGMLGTGAFRDLKTENLEETLTSNAMTGGMDGWLTLDSDRKYVMNGWFGVSRITGKEEVLTQIQRSSPHYFQRPDVDHLGVDSTATSLTGTAGRIYMNKQKGDIIFNTGLAMVSPGYDVNDLGFQWNADQINWHVTFGWQSYDPGTIFRSKFIALATFRNWDFGGNKYDEGYLLFTSWQFLNYWGLDFNYFYNPKTLSKDLTRGGVLSESPESDFVRISTYSDRRKTLSFFAGIKRGTATREFWGYDAGITWKPNTQFKLSLNPNYIHDLTEADYVDYEDDPTAVNTYGTRYLFAETVRKSISMGTRLNWTFSPQLSFQLYAQPLIFAIDYFDYKELAEAGKYSFNIYGKDNGSTMSENADGSEITVDPDGPGGIAEEFIINNRDFNFKSLRGNAVLRWEYNPGSVLYFVWTQDRNDFMSTGQFDFGKDTEALFSAESDNIFMIKATYWWAP